MWIYAWHLVKGSKAAVWGIFFVGVLLILLTAGLTSIPTMRLFNEWGNLSMTALATNLAIAIILGIITLILLANTITLLLMLGVKRSRNETISYKKVKHFLSRWLPITLGFIYISLTNLIISQIINMGLMHLFPALVIVTEGNQLPAHPGFTTIFAPIILINMLMSAALAPFFLATLPLIAERKYSAWHALTTSIKLGMKYWSQLFLLLFISQILYAITLLGAVVPYIWPLINIVLMVWFLPFVTIVFGIGYEYIIARDPLLAHHGTTAPSTY